MSVPGSIAQDQLRSLVERIERLEEEKRTLATDIREVYAEAVAHGFDARTLREVVRLRRLDAAEREAREQLRDLYMHALGMTVAEAIAKFEKEIGQLDIESASILGGGGEVIVEFDGGKSARKAKGARPAAGAA